MSAGVPTAIPEPSRTLAPAARWQWRLEGLIGVVVLLAGAVVLQVTAGGPWSLLGWAAAGFAAVVLLGVSPELRWRRWRWEVREEEVDLRHGTFAVTRTLVPMLRVQHVDTRRNLIEQGLGLATVVLHTAAGTTAIPGLPVAEAGRVRDRIAELTRTADEL